MQVAISETGNQIIISGNDGVISLFSKHNRTPIWNYGLSGCQTGSVDISANGERFVFACNGGGNTNVYAFTTNNLTKPFWNYAILGEDISPLEKRILISKDGNYVAVRTNSQTLLFDYDSEPIAHIDSIFPNPVSEDIIVNFQGHGWDEESFDDCSQKLCYLWNSSIDGPLSNSSNFNISTLSVGNHNISFQVKDSSGQWSDKVNAILVVHKRPVSVIDSISPNPSIKWQNVTFVGHGIDDGSIINYTWESDLDGLLSYESEFEFSALSIGIHNISFKVQDNFGVWSLNTSRALRVNEPPYSTIDSITPSPSENGTAVFFTGYGIDNDGDITAYNWSSSIDGVLGTQANFSSSNLSLGYHNITFSVRDNDNEWSERMGIILWIYAAPVPNAGADLEIAIHIPVQFAGKGTDEDGNIVKYEWDFDGDGTYDWSSEEHGLFSYNYNYAGIFSAVLQVTDNDGFSSTVIRNITVLSPEEVIDKYDGNQSEGGGGNETPALSILVSSMMLLLIAIFRRR